MPGSVDYGNGAVKAAASWKQGVMNGLDGGQNNAPKFVNRGVNLIDFPRANLYNSIGFLVTKWPHLSKGLFFSVRRIFAESVARVIDAPVAQW